MIAQEVKYLLAQREQTDPKKWQIPVAISARHVHLSQEAVEALFGKGHRLKRMRNLSQTEGWAAEETGRGDWSERLLQNGARARSYPQTNAD